MAKRPVLSGVVTNVTAEASPLSMNLKEVKTINYDMDTYGSTEKRKGLISKWVESVKMDPNKVEK